MEYNSRLKYRFEMAEKGLYKMQFSSTLKLAKSTFKLAINDYFKEDNLSASVDYALSKTVDIVDFWITDLNVCLIVLDQFNSVVQPDSEISLPNNTSVLRAHRLRQLYGVDVRFVDLDYWMQAPAPNKLEYIKSVLQQRQS